MHDALFMVASLFPLFIILRLAALALYASPETDDFCFSYHYADDGLLGTVAVFYKTAIGRVLPMVLMCLPAMIARPLDMFITYPMVMLTFLFSFIAAGLWVCARLWSSASAALVFFLGITLTATIAVNAISFREMFLWLPGVACYLVPAAIFMVVFTYLITTAIGDAPLSRRSVAVLGALCFLAATCNEFTTVWFVAAIAASFALRSFRQIRSHIVLAGCTLAGFLIVLAAPGNLVRMSQYPAGGRIWTAIDGASSWYAYDWSLLLQQPTVISWLALLGSASIFVIEPKPIDARKVLLISVGVPTLFLACSFVTWFVAYYATGEMLAQRARNETEVFIVMSLTFATMAVSRFAAQFLPARPSNVRGVGILICALLCLPLVNSRAMTLYRTERSSFATFWLESVQRHATISLSQRGDITVPARTARPSLLMQEDLTADPSRLPNDCVAAYYRKKSVIMR
ncbi:hypothetical protein IVB27_32485 [Bradyrhizobium sp. 197]|uniref:DUF6056 family protein n=1 Tax=Bradyrhizobium sp. 197 TaxID=2782663 RepID=UPI001FFBA2B0|nr:DUF6056 family protein [Bradyrhizobium sp. 197]MCK1479333.1 hypothetical protein [Bradyrhizobium sp. 197]